MPHEVKMPQLGMTQDSGIIVSWLKAAGDTVSEGDVLFEVETDKATMEVEAPVGGWLAGVRAGEGDDVPVGDVIALIVESEAEVGDHASTTPTEPAAEPERDATPGPDVEATPAPKPARSAPPTAPSPAAKTPGPTGKVLASPKAKRMARAQGIDLAALRAQGVPEPIHAADLSRAQLGGQSQLTAEVSGAALNPLLEKSDESTRGALFAAFAAGAWRRLFDTDDVGVALKSLDGTTSVFGSAHEVPALTVVDLCETRLTGYAPAGGGVTLTAAKNRGETYVLTLSFSEGTLPFPHAVAFLDDVAARVEDPIRQLL